MHISGPRKYISVFDTFLTSTCMPYTLHIYMYLYFARNIHLCSFLIQSILSLCKWFRSGFVSWHWHDKLRILACSFFAFSLKLLKFSECFTIIRYLFCNFEHYMMFKTCFICFVFSIFLSEVCTGRIQLENRSDVTIIFGYIQAE